MIIWIQSFLGTTNTVHIYYKPAFIFLCLFASVIAFSPIFILLHKYILGPAIFKIHKSLFLSQPYYHKSNTTLTTWILCAQNVLFYYFSSSVSYIYDNFYRLFIFTIMNIDIILLLIYSTGSFMGRYSLYRPAIYNSCFFLYVMAQGSSFLLPLWLKELTPRLSSSLPGVFPTIFPLFVFWVLFLKLQLSSCIFAFLRACI